MFPFPVVYYPMVLKRLDARYDWLPSPSSTMGNKTLPMYYCHDGCETVTGVNCSVALVTYNGNCSVFEKVSTRERSGSEVECLTRDRGAAGSSLVGVTALWSLSKTHLSQLSTGSTQEDRSLFN